MKRNMRVRFIEPAGRYTSLVGVWEDKEHPCGDRSTYHRAQICRIDYPGAKREEVVMPERQVVTDDDEVVCQYCGARARVGLHLGGMNGTLWSNGTDKPQPGDMFWSPWYHTVQEDGTVHCHLGRWDNCTDPRGHLIVVLPNGHEWDIDGRASNCDMKDERTHRCWVRHGEPPNVTVGKDGFTCHAGAGSIIGGDWHGFLRNGVLEEC